MAEIRLHNVDCMEFMKGVQDKAYDLAIVDVNYGIKQDGRSNHTRGGRTAFGSKGRGKYVAARDYRSNARYDDSHPPKEYFFELKRVSKHQIIFGANHFISMIPYNSSCWVVWDKRNGDSDFADCELAYTSFNSAVRIFRYKWSGMLQEDMKNKQQRIHPNEKPVALYKWLLKKYAQPGDNILDTHGGSMSIAIACYDLGFDLDLCELDPDYFAAGQKRIDEHISKYAPASEIPVTKKGELKLF